MESSTTLGIVAALSAEARALGRASREKQAADGGVRLAVLAEGPLVAVSGMGFAAAARSAQALADAGCGALASWGLAGGLDPALSPGMILVPERLALEGAPMLYAAPEWRARVLSSLGSRSVAGGALLTSRRAVVSTAEKQSALRRTGAAAVDMESYAIAEVAATRGLPFLAVRVIVDSAADEVPSMLAEAANENGRIAAGRLVGGILSAPASLGSLLRLAGRYRAARRSLRAIARSGALHRYRA